ncbi:MAG: efflux RND transporter periplasmic adaptor subunit, partial [Deltaproteobacteria bacterium]|nr:efflux RND transporter periplasmic adaptor subunit [Deltaproteobacteria bacterium]
MPIQARKLSKILAIATCLAAAAACKGSAEKAAAGPGGGAKKPPSAFPVETQTVAVRELEYSLAAVGTVVAFEEAQVTARVAGTVEKVSFVEGDRVQADDVLAEIEPKRYRIAVEQAAATLRRAEANLADAKKILQRRKALGPEVAAGEEIESAEAKYRIGEAELAQARAALDLAQLNLHDARVRAPAAGRIEARRVQTGSYVQPGAVIATLLRLEPLRVRFAVSETDAQRLQRDMPVRFRVRGVEGGHT